MFGAARHSRFAALAASLSVVLVPSASRPVLSQEESSANFRAPNLSSPTLDSNSIDAHSKQATVPEGSSPDYVAMFPVRLLPPYDQIKNPQLVAELRSRFLKEFARSGDTGPEEYFYTIDGALEAIGMDRAARRNTWEAILNASLLSIAERRDLVVTMSRLDPEGDFSTSRAADLANVAGMNGGRINVDLVAFHQFAPNNPLQLSVVSGSFFPGDSSNGGFDKREVAVTVSFQTRNGSQQILSTPTLVFESSKTRMYTEQTFDLPLDRVAQIHNELGSPSVLKAQIRYTANGVSQAKVPTRGPVVTGEHWVALRPFTTESGFATYKVEPLGARGVALPEPGLVEVAGMTAYALVGPQKDLVRARILEEFRAGQRRSLLEGRTIPAFEVIRSADGSKLETLDLSNINGSALIVFGATWCGPCKALRPRLDEAETRWANSGTDGNSVKVYHLSVDRDEALYGKALKEYSAGVIPPSVQENFGISAVPFFIQVNDGKVTLTGTLSPDMLANLKWAK